MCTVSAVETGFTKRWDEPWHPEPPFTPQPRPWNPNPNPFPDPFPQLTPQELAEFRRLLKNAKEIDEATDQPDCEMESKREALLEAAERRGVRGAVEAILDEVLGSEPIQSKPTPKIGAKDEFI